MTKMVFNEWKPVAAMLGVYFAFAVVNVAMKKVLTEGMSNLLIVTYRQSISLIFLVPIAYFRERYQYEYNIFLYFKFHYFHFYRQIWVS